MTHRNEFEASGTSPTENRRGIIGPISTTVWRNARKRVRKANPTVEKSNQQPAVDFALENHFSIFLLRPLSASAEAWVREFIGPDSGFQPYFPTIVIESRYVGPILEGIRESGLTLGAR